MHHRRCSSPLYRLHYLGNSKDFKTSVPRRRTRTKYIFLIIKPNTAPPRTRGWTITEQREKKIFQGRGLRSLCSFSSSSEIESESPGEGAKNRSTPQISRNDISKEVGLNFSLWVTSPGENELTDSSLVVTGVWYV